MKGLRTEKPRNDLDFAALPKFPLSTVAELEKFEDELKESESQRKLYVSVII